MRIIQNIEACIGCGACAAICPEHFEMDSQGKAQLKNSTSTDENKLEKETDDAGCCQEAADSCPVDCIHII